VIFAPHKRSSKLKKEGEGAYKQAIKANPASMMMKGEHGKC
jgi:hypothetical protein